MISTKEIIERYRFFFLFIILMFYFLIKAVNQNETLHGITSICFLSLILYSLYIIGKEKKFIFLLLFTVGLIQTLMSGLFDYYHSETYEIIKNIFVLFFYLIMSHACLSYTFKDKVIYQSTLFGALCAYLFIGQCFSTIYILIYQFNNASFAGLEPNVVNIYSDLIYFSFVTITTLGYGDILPLSKLAKTITWMESYTGQAYLTILMALLVGRFINQKQ